MTQKETQLTFFKMEAKKPSEKFSDEQVRGIMHYFLMANLVGKKKSKRKEGIKATIDGQKFDIITPIGIKQQLALEQRIKENTANSIATAFVLPKSSSAYSGNYIRKVSPEPFSEGGNIRWHHTTILSSVERYLIDFFGSEFVYYFDPKGRLIKRMGFRRYPEWHVADRLGKRPYNKEEGDDALIKYTKRLKEESSGKGYLQRGLDEPDHKRWIDLGMIYGKREERREKLSPELITKGKFSLEVAKVHKLLLAHIVKYKPPEGPTLILYNQNQ